MIKDFFKKWSPSEGCPWMNNVYLFVMTLLFGSASSVSAYDWSGNAVDNVLSADGSKNSDRSESDASKVVFLQHVGTGKWLKPGGDWGTQPALGDYATELWISKDKVNISGIWHRTYYFINTSLGSAGGSWLGYDRATDKNNPATYMDKSKGETDIYIAWNMVDLGDNKYAIASRYPIAANTLSWNASNVQLYLSYDESTQSIGMKEVDNINNATSGTDGDKRIGDPDVATLKKDPNLQWRIVTMQDIYDALDKTSSASMDEPFDLTFLIKDSGLDRCSYYNKSWTTTVADNGGDTGLKLGIENVFSSKLDDDTSDNRYGGSGKINDHGDEYKALVKPYGKYFCGQAKGGASYDVDKKYFTQNVTCPRTGWYRFSCQGFTDTPDDPSFLYASSGQTSYVRKPLVSVNSFEGTGTAPTNLTEAGQMFYKEQYTNTLYFYAKKDEKMALGLIFHGSKSWTAFDDFRLAFCGADNPELVLDETLTNVDYITNANASYNNFKGAILNLHRNFVANKWNTIVLPVRLTMSQCRDLFGNDTQIAELTGYSNGSMKFRRVEDGAKTDGDEYVMDANTPYIIKPTQANGTSGVDEDGNKTDKTVSYASSITQDEASVDEIKVTCHAPYGTTFLNHEVSHTYLQDDDNNRKNLTGDAMVEKDGLEFRGTMIKTYDNEEGNKELIGKYIIYAGKIYYVDGLYGLKGFRGYFNFKDKNEAKLFNVKFDIDGVTDKDMDVTGISDVLGDKVAAKLNPNVYTLDGKLVSTQGVTADLPKGVYVVNGKKHVVK